MAGAFATLVPAAVFSFAWKLSEDITHVDRAKSLRTSQLPPNIKQHRVEFKASDGKKLIGLWTPAEDERGVVVLSHGRGSGKGWFMRNDEVSFLHEHGYSSFVFDYRATGESDGKHCTLGDFEQLELKAAVGQAQKRSSGPLAVWGVSMGATVAILVAAEIAGIDQIIAISPYDSFIETVSHHQRLSFKLPRWPMTFLACNLTEWHTGCDVKRVDAVRAASRLRNTRLMQVHCGKDIRAPEPVQRKNFESASGPKEFHLVPNVKHGNAFRDGGKIFRLKILSVLAQLKPS